MKTQYYDFVLKHFQNFVLSPVLKNINLFSITGFMVSVHYPVFWTEHISEIGSAAAASLFGS
jgi:hypothetical protein